MYEGARAVQAVFQARSLPEPFGTMMLWLNRARTERWCRRTLGQVIADITNDAMLAALLSARRGDHGGVPDVVSFAVHALTVGS
jgi:hypothetical protein